MFNIFHRNKTQAGSGRSSIRSFAAAETSRLLAPWVWDGGFSNGDIGAALAVIRNRSRDMQKNSEHYARWLGLFVANVVGDNGFTLIPKPSLVAGAPAVDDEAAAFLKYHFWKWAKDPKCADSTGRKAFASICRLAAENWARDGEAVIHIDRNAQNRYGISLRLIRPDALDETVNGKGKASGTIVRNGVEVDAMTLAPVAYYFRANAEDPNATTFGGTGKPVVRIPAGEIIHLFTQHDETQTRGICLGHAALKKLKMLDLYNEAELAAARDEANTVGIFYTDKGEEGEVAKLNEDDESCSYLCQKSEAAQKFVLPNTWKYDSHTPQHPNREVTAFKNTMLRDIACALEVEYANFANDWAGVSFSSVRVGTLAERDHWRTLQAQMVEQVISPVFRAWLKSFLGLAASGKYGPADFDRLEEHEFRGRRWEWVDPMKDVNASVIAVANGWKTDEQIAADYGGDIDDNLEETARVSAKRKELGLVSAPAAPAASAEDEKDEN